MGDQVTAAIDAIVARDWAALRPMLHPYLHWSDLEGQVLRGRTTVLAMLEHSDPPALPSTLEYRDGQIYRWYA